MTDDPAQRPSGVTIPRLRALVAVAEEGTYSAAARVLGLSHATIAQQIHEIETRTGAPVFQRLGGRLRLTPLGAELCEIGGRMLDAEREATRVLARRDSSGREQLRIGLGNSMPGMALIAAVLRHRPRLAVSVQSGSHSQIMAAVLRREVDVAVLPDIPPDPRFRRLALLRHPVVALVCAGSELSGRGEISLAELAAAPLIFRSRGSSTQRAVDRALRLARLCPEPVLTADSRDAVYEAVASGIGVGFMWRHGTTRTAQVRSLRVPEFGAGVQEILFSLNEDRNPLIDLCFSVVADPAGLAVVQDAAAGG